MLNRADSHTLSSISSCSVDVTSWSFSRSSHSIGVLVCFRPIVADTPMQPSIASTFGSENDEVFFVFFFFLGSNSVMMSRRM